MRPSGTVTVTTLVDADAATAFEVFTAEVDTWWKHGPRFRFGRAREGRMHFEPGVGGRLVEVFDGEGDAYEVGEVTVWEPGRCLVFGFRARDFHGEQRTEVEVRFAAEGGRTRVTVEHRGWDGIPEDHPSRHGLGEPAFSNLMGQWWAELLVEVNVRAAGSLRSPPR